MYNKEDLVEELERKNYSESQAKFFLGECLFKEFDTYDVAKLLINNNNFLREEFKNQSDSDFCSVIDLLDYDGKFTDFLYTLNTLFYNFRNVEIYKNKETNIYK